MNVLNRSELIELFKSKKLILNDPFGDIETSSKLEYSRDNHFQQCSIDLSVGSIYVPETKMEDPGGAYSPKTDEHVLESGHTVMIRTKEEIILPDDIGGICFSPSRTALKAVLITNMGHVDPGYAGHLHFTAINMGKEPYTFRYNDRICSMIFFRLSGSVPPFGKEHFKNVITNNTKTEIPAVIANYFPKLSKDFANVERRAQVVAKEEIEKYRILQFGVPIAVSILALAAALIPQFLSFNKWDKEIATINLKIDTMENNIDYEQRIKTLEDKILKDK